MTETDHDDRAWAPDDQIEIDEQDVIDLYGDAPRPPEGAPCIDSEGDSEQFFDESEPEPVLDEDPEEDEGDAQEQDEAQDHDCGLGEGGLLLSLVSTAVGVGKELRSDAIDVLVETGGDLREALRSASSALREAAGVERRLVDDGDRPSGGISEAILSGAAEVAELAETVSSLSSALVDVGAVTRTLMAEHSEGDLVFDAGLLFSLVGQGGDEDDEPEPERTEPSDDDERDEAAPAQEPVRESEPVATSPEPEAETELYERLGLSADDAARAQQLAREVKVRMRARSRIEQIEEGLLRLLALQDSSDIAEAVGVSTATVNRWSRTVSEIESEEQE